MEFITQKPYDIHFIAKDMLNYNYMHYIALYVYILVEGEERMTNI